MKATGQFTIYDLNDILISPTEPPNPAEDMVWLKTYGEEPYLFYVYNNGNWKRTDYTSLEELDPEQYTIVQDSHQAIVDLDDDGALTRYERSVVRGEIATIIGRHLSSTESMPTLAQIDAGQVGDLYTIRQDARNLGLPTSDSRYVNLGNAYIALKNYLSGLAIKAWDIDTAGTVNVDSTTWDSVWNDYYVAYNLLKVTNNERVKMYADAQAGAAERAAKKYADEMKVGIDESIGTVSSSLTNLNEYIDTAFKDELVSGAAIGSIRTYIHILNSEKVNMDNRYNTIYADTDLTGSFKTNLLNAKNAYNTAHDSLINAIDSTIADGKVTEAERTNIDNLFSGYRTALGTLSKRLEQAINYISKVKAERAQENAERYADSAATQARNDAIAAVNNSDEVEEVNISNPMTINAPISTIILPSFEGRHVDSLEYWGRNLVLNSGELFESNTYYITSYNLSMDWVEGETWTIIIKGGVNDGQQFGIWSSRSTIQDRQTRLTSIGNGLHKSTFTVKQPSISEEHPGEKIMNVYNYPATGAKYAQIEWVKLVRGTPPIDDWIPAPEDKDVSIGYRIRPVSIPMFNGVSNLTVNTRFYGNGTVNDEFTWDTQGNAIKIKKWEDIDLINGTKTWTYHKTTGAHCTVSTTNIEGHDASKGTSSFIVTNHSGGIVESLPIVDTIEELYVDKAAFSFNSDGLQSYLNIPLADAGWGTSYSPEPEEIKAYLNGWRMCNGTLGTPFNGEGTKTWHPIGDTNLNRAMEETAPTHVASTVAEKKILPYQLIYKLDTPVQEDVIYDGILEAVQGDNEISITYPKLSPEIANGTYKYAINLATLAEHTRQLIPTLQKRLARAEEVITDNSIVHTVMNSVEYQVALQGKANAEDLGDLASKGELVDLADSIEGQIDRAINSIDFSPYVTQSQLDQTAIDITAKFLATGGMNLIKNSIGFAGTDFWEDTYSGSRGNVKAISSSELDTLGFGSGFLFQADGLYKGIYQDVDVIPGQIYTLSWHLKKTTAGDSDVHRFFIQILEDGVVKKQIANNREEITDGFEAKHMNYVPEGSRVRIQFVGYSKAEVVLTGVMLTIGDIPLQWSLATGELYNTNIRMDLNGLRVSQFNADGREVGYTNMSPQEFAGYYDLTGRGTFEKVFHLNEDETVTKKLRAKEEITMGSIKIVNVSGTSGRGWAFVPTVNT